MIIVTLGKFATEFVLKGFSVDSSMQIAKISELHGKPQTISIEDRTYTVVPLYHPAAMMYRPSLRSEMEQDILGIADLLRSHK